MNKPQPENTITVSCPSGHRLRGGFEMFGKNVKCPRCQAAFVFAPAKANDSDHRAVTDTGVMRILGDMPQVTPPPQPSQTDNRAITDTGVMRILGDMPQLASPPQLSQTENRGVSDTGVMRILGDASEPAAPPKRSTETALRPCSRCGIAIQESLAVCPHCNCYIGIMPTFMQKMTDNPKTSRN